MLAIGLNLPVFGAHRVEPFQDLGEGDAGGGSILLNTLALRFTLVNLAVGVLQAGLQLVDALFGRFG